MAKEGVAGGIALLFPPFEQANQGFEATGEAGAAARHRKAGGTESCGLGVGEDDAHAYWSRLQ